MDLTLLEKEVNDHALEYSAILLKKGYNYWDVVNLTRLGFDDIRLFRYFHSTFDKSGTEV